MFITKKIKELIGRKSVLFTTPGHSGGESVLPEFKRLVGRRVFKADFSEVAGMDNLQNPGGVIKKSFERASEIYGSKNTYYLVNGSTSGIIALMLSVVRRNDKVLISRNSHQSVINALILSGAFPVSVTPDTEENWNVYSGISPERIKQKLDENPEIKAVFITCPTYEGIVSDTKTIATICKERNIPLIVDESHGSLWNFSDRLPESSINLGADACVQSLHKTGSCFTQGAILHLSKNSYINAERVAQNLNIINTTSPSYLILSSIEASMEFLNSEKGRKKIDELLNNIEEIKSFLTTKLDINFLESSENYLHDPTKLFFGIKNLSGYDTGNILQEKFNTEVEFENNKGVLALTGIGTTKNKLKKFAHSLIKSEKLLKKSGKTQRSNDIILPLPEPEVICTPAQAFNRASRKIKISDAVGLVSKETIAIYPPGIPLIIAGEIVKPEHINLLKFHSEIEVILD